jgi:hypothetical protein
MRVSNLNQICKHIEASCRGSTIINIKKLAALGIRLHGRNVILIEFGLSFLFLISFGLFIFLASLEVSMLGLLFGAYLLLVGLNYLPLLLYAVVISRKNIAHSKASEESPRTGRTRKYSIQQLIILIPFLVLVLSVMQEMKTRK